MRISVCICTFRRPGLLSALLQALAQQTLVAHGHSIEIVVADNDPAHSARAVLSEWQAPAGFSLRFFHVAQPNISIARNTTVGQAQGEWLAWIDDDETPQPDWLERLVETQARFGADAVFAPVVPRYLPGTPPWIISGGFFDRARYPTGTAIGIAHARTGNVLIRAACLQGIAGPFDIGFGRTGGEDSVLFRQLLAKGCKFVWCEEAPVSEEVPLARAQASWLLSRSYRVGQTWIRGELYGQPPPRRAWLTVYLGARAAAQLLLCGLLALGWLALSRNKAFYWLRTGWTQAGKITGLTRFRYEEYGA